MAHSIDDIARATGLTAEGDGSIRVERPADPCEAGPSDLALAMSPAYADALGASGARAAVLWEGADWQALGLEAALFAPRARVALAGLGDVFAPPLDMDPGIHPTALIDPSAEIGADVWVGPFTVIGPHARIGPGSRIGAHGFIGRGAVIAAAALLHPGVKVMHGVEIGPRFIAQANAVLGADGFSYVTPEPGAVESAKATGAVDADSRNTALRRINSLGGLVIGADVEIGAGTTIDRGTVAPTRIGDGTKIDNLVMIGHNCQVGRTCLICGHVGIAGSVTIGDRVVLGGKVGIADHLKIGSDSVLAGGTLVGANIPKGSVMMGVPAKTREQAFAELKALRRLPRLVRDIEGIRQKLGL